MTAKIAGSSFQGTNPAQLVLTPDKTTVNYCVDAGAGSSAATQVGNVIETYNMPITWIDSEAITLYADNPSSSPTGSPISISAAYSAATYFVWGGQFEGYAVGILTTYSYSSGSDSGTILVFEPGAQAADDAGANHLTAALANGTAIDDTQIGSPTTNTCLATCLFNFNNDLATAEDKLKTCIKNGSLKGGAAGIGSGCLTGILICGWFLPPAGTAVCCVAGGLIGGGVGIGANAYMCNNDYQDNVRKAKRDADACIRGCNLAIQ